MVFNYSRSFITNSASFNAISDSLAYLSDISTPSQGITPAARLEAPIISLVYATLYHTWGSKGKRSGTTASIIVVSWTQYVHNVYSYVSSVTWDGSSIHVLTVIPLPFFRNQHHDLLLDEPRDHGRAMNE